MNNLSRKCGKTILWVDHE